MADVRDRLAGALSGRYTLERKLGEGGMAAVYLAHDVKHDRRVAIKVLRPELAAVIGGERFLAEIRTTANLQHPHILPLFDSGEADGFLWYVMPYVDGESLRDRLDREKQLPIGEAVGLAVKVAGALQAAHEMGVVHRDIKPANVLLDRRGEPLVADFGIALAVQHAGGRLTETGLSVGTPYYMSPEQASADRDVDARSDVYSLGCVLYEMLTGEPPFLGGSAQAVLARILTTSPRPVTEVRASVPDNVAAAIHRAVERLPADRFTKAVDFSAALSDPTFRHVGARGGGPGVAAPDPRVHSPRTPLLRAVPWVGMAVLGTILVARGPDAGDPTPASPVTSVLKLPRDLEVDPGSAWGALSPDGRTLVLTGMDDEGGALYAHDLVTGRTERLPNTADSRAPMWSPDGERIAFLKSGRLVVMARQGGAVDRLCEGEFSSLASGSWGADGTLVVSDGERLLHVDPGVSCEPLPLPEGTWRRPRHSPDGTTVFANGQLGSGGGRLYDVDLASMDLRDLGPGMQAHPTDRGYLVVLSGTAASAVPYDFEARSPSGPPRTLATGVRLNFNGSTLDVVGDRLVYLERSGAGDRPDLIVRDGEVVDSIGGASGWTLAAANEAPWVAGGGSGVEIIDPETRTVRRVASAGLELAVSPGDSLIAVGSWRFSDDCGIALIDPASGEVRRTVRACLQPLDFTPDGGALLAHRVAVGSGDLFMVDLQSGQVDTLVAEEEPIRHAALSGDGRWMAYAVGGQVIVRAVQGGVPPSVVSGQAFAVRVDWHPTEPRVFFAATPGGIYSVDIGESGRPLGPPVLRFAARWNRVGALRSNGTLFQVLADGESLLLNGLPVRDDVVTDVVVLDGWTGVLAAGGVAER